MDYKPHILTQSKFNPPDEVLSIAKYCARAGIDGNQGDPLPVGISGISHDWINDNQQSFRLLVAMNKKR